MAEPSAGNHEGSTLLRSDSDLEFGTQDAAAAAPRRRCLRLGIPGLSCVAVSACLVGAAIRARVVVSSLTAPGRSTVGLWYNGGSGAYHPIEQRLTDRLWKVERSLVKQSLCPAADANVAALREGPWPRPHAGKAPEISKFLYINMDWDEQRQSYMEHQFENLAHVWEEHGKKLSWERLAGVPASSLREDSELADWRDKGFSQARKPDVRGDWNTASCTYNHYAAIKSVPDTADDGLVVITEDDVEISPHFLMLWEKLWPFVPEKWDVLRVGWFGDHQNCSQVVNPMVDVAGWQDPREGACAYCGAQAYVVNPTSKDRVLRRFERSRITHADELLGAPTPALEDAKEVPPLQAFVVWPTLAATHLGVSGRPTFRSDRMFGEKAVVESTPDELVGLPEKYQAAVQAEIKAAREDSASALARARAEAKLAEKAADEARDKLRFTEENYYMTPKVALPPVAPVPAVAAPEPPLAAPLLPAAPPPPPPPLGVAPTWAPPVAPPAQLASPDQLAPPAQLASPDQLAPPAQLGPPARLDPPLHVLK